MAVRNFWIDASIEGRNTQLSGGPRSKDGAFSERIFIRDNGASKLALRIEGFARADGTLEVIVYNADGVQVGRVEGKR